MWTDYPVSRSPHPRNPLRSTPHASFAGQGPPAGQLEQRVHAQPAQDALPGLPSCAPAQIPGVSPPHERGSSHGMAQSCAAPVATERWACRAAGAGGPARAVCGDERQGGRGHRVHAQACAGLLQPAQVRGCSGVRWVPRAGQQALHAPFAGACGRKPFLPGVTKFFMEVCAESSAVPLCPWNPMVCCQGWPPHPRK